MPIIFVAMAAYSSPSIRETISWWRGIKFNSLQKRPLMSQTNAMPMVRIVLIADTGIIFCSIIFIAPNLKVAQIFSNIIIQPSGIQNTD
jgi:hypothetical protein